MSPNPTLFNPLYLSLNQTVRVRYTVGNCKLEVSDEKLVFFIFGIWTKISRIVFVDRLFLLIFSSADEFVRFSTAASLTETHLATAGYKSTVKTGTGVLEF